MDTPAVFGVVAVPKSFGVCRFVPLIADVDVLFIFRILVLAVSDRRIGVDVEIAADAFSAGRRVRSGRGEVVRHGVCQMAGGADLFCDRFAVFAGDGDAALEQVRNADGAARAGRADVHGRVDRRVFDEAHLHRVGGVGDDDDGLKVFRHHVEQILFALGDAEQLSVLVVLARRDILLFRIVVALAHQAAEHDDGGIRILDGVVDERVRIEVLGGFGHAVVVVIELFRRRLDDEGAALDTAEGKLRIRIGELGVVLDAGLRQPAEEGDIVVARARARAGALGDKAVVAPRPAEYVDLVGLEGQRVVLVFQEHGPLFFYVFRERVAALARGDRRRTVFVKTIAAQEGGDDVCVEVAGHVADDERDDQDQADDARYDRVDQFFRFHVSFSLYRFCFRSLPRLPAGGRAVREARPGLCRGRRPVPLLRGRCRQFKIVDVQAFGNKGHGEGIGARIQRDGTEVYLHPIPPICLVAVPERAARRRRQRLSAELDGGVGGEIVRLCVVIRHRRLDGDRRALAQFDAEGDDAARAHPLERRAAAHIVAPRLGKRGGLRPVVALDPAARVGALRLDAPRFADRQRDIRRVFVRGDEVAAVAADKFKVVEIHALVVEYDAERMDARLHFDGAEVYGVPLPIIVGHVVPERPFCRRRERLSGKGDDGLAEIEGLAVIVRHTEGDGDGGRLLHLDDRLDLGLGRKALQADARFAAAVPALGKGGCIVAHDPAVAVAEVFRFQADDAVFGERRLGIGLGFRLLVDVDAAFVEGAVRDDVEEEAVDVAASADDVELEQVVARRQVVDAERNFFPQPIFVRAGVAVLNIDVVDAVERVAVDEEAPIILYDVLLDGRDLDLEFDGGVLPEAQGGGELRARRQRRNGGAAAGVRRLRFVADCLQEDPVLRPAVRGRKVGTGVRLFAVDIFEVDKERVFDLFRQFDDGGDVARADVKVDVIEVDGDLSEDVEGEFVGARGDREAADDDVCPRLRACGDRHPFERDLPVRRFIRLVVEVQRELFSQRDGFIRGSGYAEDHSHFLISLVRREGKPEVVARHAVSGEIFVAADDDLLFPFSRFGRIGDEGVVPVGKFNAGRFHIDVFRLDAIGRALVFTDDIHERLRRNVGDHALLHGDGVLRALAPVRDGDAALTGRAHRRGRDAAFVRRNFLFTAVAHLGGHFQAVVGELLSVSERRFCAARVQHQRLYGGGVVRTGAGAGVGRRTSDKNEGACAYRREDQREHCRPKFCPWFVHLISPYIFLAARPTAVR